MRESNSFESIHGQFLFVGNALPEFSSNNGFLRTTYLCMFCMRCT